MRLRSMEWNRRRLHRSRRRVQRRPTHTSKDRIAWRLELEHVMWWRARSLLVTRAFVSPKIAGKKWPGANSTPSVVRFESRPARRVGCGGRILETVYLGRHASSKA